MRSKSHWPAEYYKALRFYYWEPQWLNRHANAVKGENRVEQVILGLKKAEVSLNHILNIFFNLAPSALTTRFLSAALPDWTPERMEAQTAPKLDIAPEIDLCQTDILLEGQASRVAMELKIKAKTSLDQIMKYALFLHFYGDQSTSAPKTPFLLFISPSEGSFLPKNLDLRAKRAALETVGLKPTVAKFAAASGQSRSDVLDLAASLAVVQTTYDFFAKLLRDELGRVDPTEAGETLINLIGGVLAELSARGLAQ